MIAVTGATGHLGRLVVEGLLTQVPAGELVAAVRDPAKANDLAARGVHVRRADYAEPATLAAAFSGVKRVLLISSNELGRRGPQHAAVIEAARRAEVRLLVYTSILRATDSTLALGAEHRATEELIRASGLPYVLLRNGWYFENYTENLAPALQHGALVGSAREGRIAAAARADYAQAAVAVLTGVGHENSTYELAGDQPFTMTELAAEVSRQAGKTIGYRDLPPDAHREVLVGAGVPAPFADVLVDCDGGVAAGELDDSSGALRRLIGRPTTTLAAAVAAALGR